MQVEILEEKLSSDGFTCAKGDRITVSDEIGAAWCGRGWCKDMAEKVTTGERNTKPVEINPKKVQHNTTVKEV